MTDSSNLLPVIVESVLVIMATFVESVFKAGAEPRADWIEYENGTVIAFSKRPKDRSTMISYGSESMDDMLANPESLASICVAEATLRGEGDGSHPRLNRYVVTYPRPYLFSLVETTGDQGDDIQKIAAIALRNRRRDFHSRTVLRTSMDAGN